MGRATRARQAAQARTKRIRIAVAVTATVVLVAVMAVIVAVHATNGVAATAGGDANNTLVGKPFPDFALTTIDGSQVTRSSLVGKPSLVWFTTVTCVPAQVGAIKVRQLNQELGNRIRVLVVFVAEPDSALASWRDTYAQPAWTIARDPQTDLVSKVNLSYVDDTKFLLNDRGQIVDIDPTPVSDGLLQLMRKQVVV